MLSGCTIYSPKRSVLLPPGSKAQRAYYIHTSAWGFRRCSFRLDGQCEGLLAWDERQVQFPRFFVVNLLEGDEGEASIYYYERFNG